MLKPNERNAFLYEFNYEWRRRFLNQNGKKGEEFLMEKDKQRFGEIMVEEKKLFVGKQDFDNSTVEIFDNENITKAPMFIDESGELYFEYLGKKYWFSEI